MAKKTREQAMATREQLLDAAERVFRERGVGHTSLAEVADAAGVTRGALYHHFSSKADLFRAMVDRVEMPLDAALAEMRRAAAADPLRAVRTLAIHALQYLATSARTQAVYDVMFRRCEYTSELATVQGQQKKETEKCQRECEALFADAAAKGDLPADTDATLAARGLYAFVGGLMRDWVERPSYDLERHAPALIDVYLAGLPRQPPRRAARVRRTAPAARARRRRTS